MFLEFSSHYGLCISQLKPCRGSEPAAGKPDLKYSNPSGGSSEQEAGSRMVLPNATLDHLLD